MKKFLLFIFILSLISFLVLSFTFIDPNLIYLKKIFTGFAFSNRTIVSIAYLILICVLFYSFWNFLILYREKKLNKKEIYFLIGFPAILLLAYPAMLSYDIFNYVFTSKVLFFYRENPYIMMPINFLGDPLLDFTRAANKTALYGPIWTLISAVPYYLGIGNFLLTMYLFKVFVAIFYFGTIYLIYKFTKNLENVLFFAFNPLVFIETFLSGHNDVVMMFLALLTFYFLKNKKIISSLFLLFASIFIKFASVFILPTFFLIIYKNYKKREINYEKLFFQASILMLIIFYLSFLREEIYPWYAVWFLSFLSLTKITRTKLILVTVFSFSLMLRYIPFMYLGTYFGPTPIIKIAITFIPVSIFVFYYILRSKQWLKFLK